MKSLLTDKTLLKKGGRKGAIISPKELEEKIIKLGERYAYKEYFKGTLLESVDEILLNDSKVKKDLSKISFDTENIDVGDLDHIETGFHTLDNGFTFLLCIAGGDWECAVGFILYWDGKDIRGYIPVLGNTFNPKTKSAFGGEDDLLDPQDHFAQFVLETTGRPITTKEENDFEYGEYYIDFELFKEDIMSRIEIDAEEVEKYKESLKKKETKKSASKNSSPKSLKFKTGDTIYVAGSLEECEAFPCMFLTQIGSSALVLTSFSGDGSLEESLMGCMEFIDTDCPSGIFAVPVENCFATEEESVEAFENGEYTTY